MVENIAYILKTKAQKDMVEFVLPVVSLSDLFIDYEIEVGQSFFLWGLDRPRLQRKYSPTIHILLSVIML